MPRPSKMLYIRSSAQPNLKKEKKRCPTLSKKNMKMRKGERNQNKFRLVHNLAERAYKHPQTEEEAPPARKVLQCFPSSLFFGLPLDVQVAFLKMALMTTVGSILSVKVSCALLLVLF